MRYETLIEGDEMKKGDEMFVFGTRWELIIRRLQGKYWSKTLYPVRRIAPIDSTNKEK